MRISDAVTARWGDDPARDVLSDDVDQYDIRLAGVWRAITLLSGTTADPPLTIEVHSPRALPGVLSLGGQPRLIWDAGIGSIFDALAFPMPYPQPEPVVEALLRRIISVRYILAGFGQKAADQVNYAEQLLRTTPIDRHHQIHADAESQFEVWLLTEMQEQFALAHELAHHLRNIDPDAFNNFATRILDAAGQFGIAGENRGSIFHAGLDPTSFDTYGPLRDRDLDLYAWYLTQWRTGESSPPVPPDRHYRAMNVLTALKSSPHLQEEVCCDLIASLAVSVDADLRQRGWTAIMGASCSRLALANLGLTMGIDGWIAGRQPTAWNFPADILARGECMEVLLPGLLSTMLREHSVTSALEPADSYDVMLLVSKMHEETFRPTLQGIEQATAPPEGEPLSAEAVLIKAGFMNLRPSPDWRYAARAAMDY